MLEILKPSPLPMKIFSSPSKWVNYLIFWESPVTWKLTLASGIQVELDAPLSWEEEFVSMALGWLGPGIVELALGLTQVLEDMVETAK